MSEWMGEKIFNESQPYKAEVILPVRNSIDYISEVFEEYLESPQDSKKNINAEFSKLDSLLEIKKKNWEVQFPYESKARISTTCLFEFANLFKHEYSRSFKDMNRIEAEWHGAEVGSRILKDIRRNEIDQKKADAAWQQKLSLLIFKEQGNLEFEESMARYWKNINRLEKRLLGSERYADSIKSGVGHLVTAVSVMDQLGFSCQTAGAEHDVSDSMDFIAVKRIEDSQLILFFQVKGSREEDNFEPRFDFYYPLPDYSADIPKGMFNLVKWIKQNTQTFREREPKSLLIPIFFRVPSAKDRVGEISASGLPSRHFIDKLPELFLNRVEELNNVPTQVTNKEHKRKKLRVVNFKKGIK